MTSPPSNLILRSLDAADYLQIRPLLRPIPMRQRDVFGRTGEPITEVHFVEAGIVSLVTAAPEYRIEVGIIGREGLVGPSLILEVESSPFECFCQVDGEVLAMSVTDLRSVMTDMPVLRHLILQYVHSLMVQSADTALANARCTLEERLARWLLMVRDRLRDDRIPLTHEFLSVMLGVHRPGVTVALQSLEGAGMIRNSRGLVAIVNVGGLSALAGGSYRPT